MRYKIERGNEEINSTGGVSLMGAVMNRAGVFRNSEFESHGGKLTHAAQCAAMTALLCQGRSDFVNIELHGSDPVFMESLGMDSVPPEATFRQNLSAAADYGTSILPKENAKPLRLVESFGTLSGDGTEYVPVHLDVTPMDNSGTKKEGTSKTYKGLDGYAPMMAYVGTQGYMLNCELREGKAHSQNGTVEQYHSEYKTDLNLERLPSGSFKTNDLILRLGMLSFNILRLVGQTALSMPKLMPVKLRVGRR